ncbi:lipid A export permease/ATP-binding protein MsbA [Thiomicrorhabdus indica]|uniref:lipid A export permease/ATP-binding protein MsbA n=1 Tax=Thiomicrorhabdus indica TaxID=2267253 RepID=UPI001F0F9FD0|nr:lipid A export permease/ATP-binding protein MsbA [Thiomicrorhabdus indica]
MIADPKTIALYKRLLTYIRPYWKAVAITIVALFITAAMTPLLPALLKDVVDESLIAKNEEAITTIPLLIILIFMVRGFAEYASKVAGEWVAHKAIQAIRSELFAKIQRLSETTHREYTEGKLLSKITYDVPQVGATLSQAWIVIIKESLIVSGLLGFLFYTTWQLTLLIIVIAPIVALVFNRASKLMRKSNKNIQASMGVLTQRLGESLKGHKEIKMYGAQSYEQARFDDASETFRKHTMKSARVAAANVPVIQLIASVSLAGVIYVASVMSANDQLTTGEFIAFITAMVMIFDPIRRLTNINATIQRGMAAAESIFDVLDHREEPNSGTQKLENKLLPIYFKNIEFAYGHERLFKDFSLTIPAGKSLALVGSSGSGKTTLVNLLTRFYDPKDGEILIGNQNIHNVETTSLRDQIAYVSQNVVLFNDTIAANIAYGKSGIPEEDIIKAAQNAHAWEFIESLPAGLDTMIGENGASLSGGQRQRIAIARAFLKNAPILILDEATSALDNESERQIQLAMEQLKQNRTVIMIAHRLTTIENADHIIVLDHGKLIEQGTHQHLLGKKGYYATLYQTGNLSE